MGWKLIQPIHCGVGWLRLTRKGNLRPAYRECFDPEVTIVGDNYKKIPHRFEPMREIVVKRSFDYAPNLSNIRALACMRRIKYFAGKIPSEPEFAPVSVKRSSLSQPLTGECRSSGCGCQE